MDQGAPGFKCWISFAPYSVLCMFECLSLFYLLIITVNVLKFRTPKIIVENFSFSEKMEHCHFLKVNFQNYEHHFFV